MIAALWQKQIPIRVQLKSIDVADWISPLPLFFTARWNHYIGIYQPLIYDFFLPFLPFPHNEQQLSLTLTASGLRLDGTEIVAHLFTLYALDSDQPLTLECQLRRHQPIPMLDLKRFFKQNLKASTCIRYGKFGSKAITVDMSVNNIEDMYNNFVNNKLQAYCGQTQPESTNLGYLFIVENEEKIESMPIRILGKDWRIERSVRKKSKLSELWMEIAGQTEENPRLHGVKLKSLDIQVKGLEKYCHPDGFLYLTF